MDSTFPENIFGAVAGQKLAAPSSTNMDEIRTGSPVSTQNQSKFSSPTVPTMAALDSWISLSKSSVSVSAGRLNLCLYSADVPAVKCGTGGTSVPTSIG